MSRRLIEAVYENGALRPLSEIDPPLADGQRVQLVVEIEEGLPHALELATRVFDDLAEAKIQKIENIALDRGCFFDPRKSP